MYRSSKPEATRTQYLPFDNVDFKVNFPGFDYVQNSARVSGRLVCTSDIARANPIITRTADVAIDSYAGIHGAFQQVTTSFSDSIIENIQHYPRYARMKHTCTNTQLGGMSMASDAIELKQFNSKGLGQAVIVMTDFTLQGGRSFSFKPNICLNNLTNNLSYQKSGEIKVSLQVSSEKMFLFGANAATASFYLTDLEFHYLVVPSVSPPQPVQIQIISAVKQNVTTSNQMFNILAPIPTTSFSASFISLANEINATANYLEMECLQNLTAMELTVNDSSLGLLQYPLTHQQEILINGLLSMGYSGKHCFQYEAEDMENAVRVIGMKYGNILQNIKLGINLQSATNNTAPYSCYIYFKGIRSL